MGLVIEVNRLVKTYKVPKREAGMRSTLRYLIRPVYRDVEAVADVSFSVNRGEIVGYLGPNGAGKSTTLKILTGTLLQTSGEVRVFGLRPYEDRRLYLPRIGALFGQRSQLWWDLPVGDSFHMIAEIYQVSQKNLKANIDWFKEQLGLDAYLNRSVRQLSLGERMRCELAASLLHDPEVVFLDEPTIGLDVSAKHSIRSFLKEINWKREVTVVLASHDLGDIESLCHRVILIDRGHVVVDGTLGQLREQHSGTRLVRVKFHAPVPPDSLRAVLEPNLREVGGSLDMPSPQEAVVSLPASRTIGAMIDRLGEAGSIADLSVEEPRLEDVIRNLYGRERNE